MTFVVEESSLLDSRDLWYELNLLKKLQAEPHPNVVQLLGCLTKDIFQCEGREFSMFGLFHSKYQILWKIHFHTVSLVWKWTKSTINFNVSFILTIHPLIVASFCENSSLWLIQSKISLISLMKFFRLLRSQRPLPVSVSDCCWIDLHCMLMSICI